jgi:hypothetical protein
VKQIAIWTLKSDNSEIEISDWIEENKLKVISVELGRDHEDRPAVLILYEVDDEPIGKVNHEV